MFASMTARSIGVFFAFGLVLALLSGWASDLRAEGLKIRLQERGADGLKVIDLGDELTGSAAAAASAALPAKTEPEGAVHHIEAVLSNTSQGALGPVLLTFKAENLKIAKIGTKAYKFKSDGADRFLFIDKLAPGKPVTIPVEVHLGGGDVAVREQSSPSRLLATATLAAAAGVDATARASRGWIVAHCGRRYHAQLQAIRDNDIATLKSRIAAAARPGAAFTGRWLTPGAGTRRVKVWDRRRRRHRWRTVATGPRLSREEAAIVRAARQVVARRGVGRLLKHSMERYRVSWIVRDIRHYTGQDYRATICTGGPGYADSIDQLVAKFTKKAETPATQLAKALSLARVRLEEVREAVNDTTGSTGTVSTVAAEADAEPDVAVFAGQLADEVKALTDEIAAAEATAASAEQWLSRLDALGDSLGEDSPLSGGENGDLRARLVRALRLTEAAVYLHESHRRYAAIKAAIGSVLDAVRKAHDEECRCSG